MKISVENPEALKSWLTKTLSPICDADPQALAKYVLALVKKEKEEQDLKDVCAEQLDVFLQEKTKEFVETLFVALKDKSYLPPPPPPVVEESKPPTPPPPPPTPPPAPPEPPRDPPSRETTYRKTPPPKQSESYREDTKIPTEDLRNRLTHKDESRKRSRSPYRDRSPLRNRSPLRGRSPPRRRGGVFDRLDRRRFSPDRGRPRYSSRYSPDRKRRSPLPRSPVRRSPRRSPLRRSPGRSPLRRSPGKSPTRRSPGRSPLRRSPGRSPLRRSPGRSPIRRSPGRSPLRRSPGRSPLRRSPGRSPIRSPNRRSPRSPLRRSPRGRSPLPRGRSPLPRVKSRSPDSRLNKRFDNKSARSVSRERLPRSRSRTPPPRRRFRPRSWSMSSSGLSDSLSPKGRSPDSRGSTPRDYSPYNRTTNTRDFPRDVKPSVRARCRDYDEKGVCMKGDLCQFDHGNDPVVIDDVSLPNVLQLNQNGPPPPPSGPPSLPVIHQRPPGPGQPMLGPRGPPISGQRPPMPPLGPMGPRPMIGGPPPPPLPPGQRPILRPGFPAAELMHMKGATPPPPGTVPIRMPPQVFNQRPPTLPPAAFAPEPYNPEAPSISAVSSQPAYVPTQIGSRPTQVSAHQRLGPVVNPPPPVVQAKQEREATSAHIPPGNLVNISPASQQQAVVSTVEVGASTDAGSVSRTVLLGKRENNGSAAVSNGNSDEPAHKRQAFDKSRLGAKNFASNNTLELRKIPREMNNIASLNQHFSKFGLITNLQITFNGDPEAAIVSFASPAQARAAYKCTEPIFNNRFVRVFWHNPTDENTKPQTTDKKVSVKDRLGIIPPAHKLSLNNMHKNNVHDTEKQSVSETPTGLTKTVFNPDALKKQNVQVTTAPAKPAKPPAHQQAALEQKANMQKQEVLKKKLEIQKKKQQLLQEQLKQQKILIGKLENNKTISADDRNSILKTIKVLADSIEKLKHELLAASQQQKPKPKEPEQKAVKKQEEPAPPVPKTPTTPEEQKKVLLQHKQQAQKAILDTELDIINKSYEGADTSELRQKVARLKEEAMSLGLLGRGRGTPPRGGFRGRGGGVGRGRGSYAISHMVDRRPKQLVVMGFLLEEKDEVLKQLGEYGEIESVISDDTVPSVNINFKTRQGAEMAAREGQAFKKKRLVMMWHKPESVSSEASSSQESQDNPQTGKVVEEVTAIEEEVDTLVVEAADDAEQLEALDEAALLGLDEEEEGETDRSWKP